MFQSCFDVNFITISCELITNCQGTDLIQELTTIYKTKDEEGRES